MIRFFRFFITRRIITNIFTITVIIAGLAAVLQMKRDVFPEVDFGEVLITTRYPGASPADVELNVTNKIEDELRSVSGIDEITSYSMENFSVITVKTGVDAADKEEIIDDVREAVSRVTDLPPEVTEAPLVDERDTGEFPVIEAGVAGNRPYGELREAARLLRKRLENVPGVSRVNGLWYLDREIWIEASPDALSDKQVALQEIVDAVRQRNIRSTAGTIEDYDSADSIVTESEFGRPGDSAEVVIRSTLDGPALRVRDVAKVTDTFEKPRILSRINSIPSITFQVLKKQEADVVRTVKEVRAACREEERRLPDGVRILFTNDASRYVQDRFNVLVSDGLIGFILVVIFLAVFLNWRAAFWVAFSIPLVLLGTLFIMSLFGVYLEIISLTGIILVIGIIVDDGIVVAENIIRRREEGASPEEAAAGGITEIIIPVFSNLLTTILAFAPLFFMTGIAGQFVKNIPLVVSIALAMSLIEVIVALPAHLAPGLSVLPVCSAAEKRWFVRLRSFFGAALAKAVFHRRLTLILAFLLFAGSLFYAVNFIRFDLFPDEAANAFFIYFETPDGSSIEKTADTARGIEEAVAALSAAELSSFSTVIGTHGEREPGESPRWGYVQVNLTPYSRKRRTADAVVAELKQKTAKLRGFKEMTFEVEAGGPPVGDPVTIRIASSNDSQRRSLTDAVTQHLRTIKGVTDIKRNDENENGQVRVDLDYRRLSQLGLTVSNVARTMRNAYDGEVATSVRYGEDDVDFRIILDKEARGCLDCVPRILIPNREGRLIRFGDVARIGRGISPMSYYHFDRERTAMVTADVVRGTVTPLEVTNDVVRRFNVKRDWPETRLLIGGESEETQESFRGLYIAFGAAVFGIYLLLLLLFNSFTQPLIMMAAIPFGITAVIIAFAITGMPLGFLAMVGLVGLTGVVVEDSIIMVDHLNDSRRANPDAPLNELVVDGACDRLRPILINTLSSVLGLIPLAYGLGGSDPFIEPMALALSYGLFFAMPLTLFVVPCLYAAWGATTITLRGFKIRLPFLKRKDT